LKRQEVLDGEKNDEKENFEKMLGKRISDK
jgi:hypothetical protein